MAQVWDEYSPEAAYERWGWASPATLAQLAGEGRRLLRARTGEPTRLGSRRSTAAEQDAVIVAAVKASASASTRSSSTVIVDRLVDGLLARDGLAQADAVRAIPDDAGAHRQVWERAILLVSWQGAHGTD